MTALDDLLDQETPTNRTKKRLFCFWLLVVLAMPVWMAFDHPAWDFAVYHTALKAVVAGRDPYADAIAVEKLFHSQLALHPNADPPFSYVYSPITLPILRFIGSLPAWFSSCTYWMLYLAGILAEIWVGTLMLERGERRYLIFLAPVAAFFPGFLANGVVLSGNIAYLIYGAALLTAVLGWRRGTWLWFYLVAIAGSCVKAPLLILVLIPVLSARKQWLPAGLAAGAGIVLFAMQRVLWPATFAHYMELLGIMFAYDHDFGCGPAGLFSEFLHARGLPYWPAGPLFYVAYASLIAPVLLYLSRLYLAGTLSLRQWLPVLLTGVILLNPRLIEYDVAPLAIPLTIIAWRFLNSLTTARKSATVLGILFALTNSFGLYSWELRKIIDGPLLVCFFLAGSWMLLQESRASVGVNLGISQALPLDLDPVLPFDREPTPVP